MAKMYDKDTIFNKLKDEADKKGFNINPDRKNMGNGTPTMVELLEVIAIVINDILSKDASKPAEIKATEVKLDAGGLLKGVARKEDEITIDITTDPNFMTFIEAFYSAIQASSAIPQPPGAPNTLAVAFNAALAAVKPTKLKGKITTASDKVKTS